MKCRTQIFLTLTILFLSSCHLTVATLLSSVLQSFVTNSPQTKTHPYVLDDNQDMLTNERHTDLSPIKSSGELFIEPELNSHTGFELCSFQIISRAVLADDESTLDACGLEWLMHDKGAKNRVRKMIFDNAIESSLDQERKWSTIRTDMLSGENKRGGQRLSINTALHSLADMLKSQSPKSRFGNSGLIRKIIDKGK